MSSTTPVSDWVTQDRDGNVVKVGETGVPTNVNFTGLLGVFYGRKYAQLIPANESLFEGAISFRSIFAFTGKSVFYTILLEGESYTWTYLETGFTLNPDPIQSNFSGLIDGFYKQLAAVDHQSYFIAPNAPRTAIQSLKTFLYDANETLQIQLLSQAAKSKFAWFALLPLLLVALILAAVYIWASCFRKRK